jgi:hypothetical protein
VSEENDSQRTWLLWLEHTSKCGQCERATDPADGCRTGRDLWGEYRLARIGRRVAVANRRSRGES